MKFGVGIDVSKGKSTVSIMSTEGEIIEKPFEISHNREGLELLVSKMEKLPKNDIKIMMENTSTYHLPVYVYLMSKDYFVIQENAFKIKKYLDREIRKAKTDKKDALKLAEYVCDNWNKLKMAKPTEEIYSNLQFLSRQYLHYIDEQSREKIHFSDLCDLLFPGYYQLLGENNFILGLEVFKRYYHPDLVMNKKQSQFVNEIDGIAKELGHKSAGRTLANKIYELAQRTISPRPNNQYAQLSAKSCADVLINIIKTSDTIISEMDNLARELPEYEVVREMPGVGNKLVSRIIAEVGDIRRFDNAGSLIAYVGLDTPPYQSGQFTATNCHISKRGNKYARRTGYEIIQSLRRNINSTSELRLYLIKKDSEGKLKKVSNVAGENKFFRMYFGSVRKHLKELGVW